MLRRFVREAQVIAQLSHPAIVQIYDVGTVQDSPFIVMEYVDGLDLAAVINKGKVRLGWAIHIARQIAEAIKYAQRRAIVHRDIKPSNILVDAGGEYAKLTDFGLAKALSGLTTVTSPGAVVGTPAYMSPEQFRDSNPGSETDIYSFGATLYHLFTGQAPRGNIDLVTMVRESLEKIPEAPSKLRNDIPERLSKAILALMEPDPAKRVKSLDSLIEVLSELSSKFSIPPEGSLLERAIEKIETKPDAHTITQIREESVPTGFFESKSFPKFFEDDAARFTKIQESLKFYRDHLSDEYHSLIKQANTTYQLWLVCVLLGFAILIAGIIAMLMGNVTEGVATTASTIVVYFIQRIFQQREDHYRSLAKAKNAHLEYGNQWLLIIQSIDSIENPNERAKRQAKLVDALTEKLKSRSAT